MGLFSVQNKILFGKLKHAKHRSENTLAQLDSHYYNHGNVWHPFLFKWQPITINTRKCRFTGIPTSIYRQGHKLSHIMLYINIFILIQ
jgi:hypothetical protein